MFVIAMIVLLAGVSMISPPWPEIFTDMIDTPVLVC
jgi:hypothetical protein